MSYSRNTETIKNDLLDKFREIPARAGYILPPRWLSLTYLPTLNPKEQKLFENALNELITEGIVEYVQGVGMNTLKLTQKGEDEIY